MVATGSWSGNRMQVAVLDSALEKAYGSMRSCAALHAPTVMNIREVELATVFQPGKDKIALLGQTVYCVVQIGSWVRKPWLRWRQCRRL